MELQVIQQRIYTIRNQRVMLDFDLAEIYGVETKALNQAMKRNISRFPDEFVFRLSDVEWESMWSQIVTTSKKLSMRSQFVTASEDSNMWSHFATTSAKKRRKDNLPFAFTEHGVAMLASVLKSEKAIEMNIAIVKAFIALRQVAITHYDILSHFNELRDRLGEHDVQLAAIYDTIETLLDKKITEEERRETWENRNLIGFKPDEKPGER